MHSLLNFINNHQRKITIISVVIPLIIQFKAIIFYPLLKLYDILPSYSETYDRILSIRMPFLVRDLLPKDRLKEELALIYQEKKYNNHAITNLNFIIEELFALKEKANSDFAKEIELALNELKGFKFKATIIIFHKLAKFNNPEKYIAYKAMTAFLANKQQGIIYFKQGLKLNPNNLFLLNNLAKSYIDITELTKAEKIFRYILQIAEQEKKPELIILAQANLGNIELLRTNYSAALTHFKLALNLSKAQNFKLMQANQYKNLGVTEAKLGQQEKSCINFRKARIIYYKLYLDSEANKILTYLKERQCI